MLEAKQLGEFSLRYNLLPHLVFVLLQQLRRFVKVGKLVVKMLFPHALYFFVRFVV